MVEQTLDSVLDQIERRERRAARRAVAFTAIPVLMAAVLLGYSTHRITTAASEVRDLEAKLAETTRLLDEAQRRLGQTTDLGRFEHRIDFGDYKMLASRYPREAEILGLVLRARNQRVGWRLGGTSPAEGFDSPGFAIFILRELNLPGGGVAEVPGGPTATAQALLRRLRPVTAPEIGGLAFYSYGYVMFTFVDRNDRPFVIGMTPSGIVALAPGFDPLIGYRSLR